MTFIRHAFVLMLSVCLGCVAQSAAPASSTGLSNKIERQVRSYYKIPPDVKISVSAPVPSSEFPNYDSVSVIVDNGEKKQDLTFLVSKDRSSLMRTVKFDLNKDPFVETMNKIDISGRPTRGAKGSKVVLVNFDDFECPFCSRLHHTLFPEILKEYGDRVTFIYKDYPLVEIHPWAMHAAVDANCLAAQNPTAYWNYVDYLHNNGAEVSGSGNDPAKAGTRLDQLADQEGTRDHLDTAKLLACVAKQDDSQIRAEMKAGDKLGVDATPTFFVNGERWSGILDEPQLWTMIDRALKEQGIAPPAEAPAPAAAPATGQGPADGAGRK